MPRIPLGDDDLRHKAHKHRGEQLGTQAVERRGGDRPHGERQAVSQRKQPQTMLDNCERGARGKQYHPAADRTIRQILAGPGLHVQAFLPSA